MPVHCNAIFGIVQIKTTFTVDGEEEQAEHEQTMTAPLLESELRYDATEYGERNLAFKRV